VAGVGIELSLSERWSVGLDADTLLLFSRPRFVLEDHRPIYQPPTVGFGAQLGIGTRW
jgi:hypothetical protein